ncbi:selenocysteine-specific translation elongation factor [Glaesserella parasuis]|uniref:selenocysteine-specific translation elongation factor n=1 Tax=Glaesserella parasuis TaxID=738 RepID=UPI0004EDA146|nr:selenocysteine-specific translation elongation factor [Glaesserella parasuis]AIK90557.1 translation elongation factor [Glaesserella parasuis]MDG6237455.1 selenocysteine-specific translation elongation factor [Glaesserella parasuis]MDG6259351.1 selenocysteine-specific translation elongation factor [Glaesserella parasuis]MDG6265506.1 selenocysteine-specific translation elongation factor [Glaesserella parasuis]MDG6269860.1 selenocysteine-specific translation elongation factor [Glaesserella par
MIIVTAGHVDHGKTSLLYALTGTHTAHLPEEKKRGLTIDLGYAYLPIENDILGFIDVPGHQKFLSNMLAGLGGVQHALLVISSEEGIKPQTEEHLAILRLLNFKQIIVVLTKADRAEATRITQLIEQLKQRYPFLASAHFFVTSAQTGEGIKPLKHYLISLNHQSTQIDKPFRYAIDRVFNVKGAGLVVTGTAVAGKVAIGDEFYLSSGQKVRIKNIHAQNNEASIGVAGQRLALNIANVEKEQIERGDWITQQDPQFACDRITVRLTTAQALKENSVVHLYHFASHTTAKLNLLDGSQCLADDTAIAELILDTPLHIALEDKLILRSGDDSQTLAGAEVIEIHSPKRHKRSEARLSYLSQLANCTSYQERIALYLQHKAVNLTQLLWAEQIFIRDLEKLAEKSDYYLNSNHLFNGAFKTQIQQHIVAKLEEYHQQHSDQLGVTKARLHRIATLELSEQLAFALIDELIADNTLAQTRGWIHTPTHRIEFNDAELQIWAEIRPLFERTNQALWVRDIASELSIDETEMRDLLYKAGKLGYLVPIVKDRFLLHEQISAFAQLIKNFIEQHGEISVNQLRDEIQYGRKVTVQLIEYFDRSGFLRRKGNVHLLRDRDTY